MKSKFFYILAVFICAMFLVVLIFLGTKQVPAENKDLINIALGALISAFISVVQYYFGSSSGSVDKTAIIAGINENKD